MYLIDHDFHPINPVVNVSPYSTLKFWEYDTSSKVVKDSDGKKHTLSPHFRLTHSEKWMIIESAAYVIRIGKYSLTLPVNHYLLIGDFDAGLDFVRIDEVVGREFEVFTFASNFEEDSWTLRELKILDMIPQNRVIYPSTKKPVAIHLGDNSAIMVSLIDNYSKMQDLSFGNIV